MLPVRDVVTDCDFDDICFSVFELRGTNFNVVITQMLIYDISYM